MQVFVVISYAGIYEGVFKTLADAEQYICVCEATGKWKVIEDEV